MSRTALLLPWVALALAGCAEPPRPPVATTQRKLVVIGVDGMDPKLLRQYMNEGRVPHLAQLAARGSFGPLQTTDPPQSPVAWSTFITGLSPDGHGIYDFVHRDPETLEPYLSTSKTEAADTFSLGPIAITTSAPEVELKRAGAPFWSELERGGVPATVLKIPANFPAVDHGPSHVLAGMGTPDLLGTYGTFQLLTNDPVWTGAAADPSGGLIRPLRALTAFRHRGTLVGPTMQTGETLTLPVEIVLDEKQPAALVQLGDARALIVEGEWSDWLPLAFDGGLLTDDLPGAIRLYLKSSSPHLNLYVSPINLDPKQPVMPISSPPSFARQLADRAGRFYTQGMAEDTKALSAGVLDRDEFLAQAGLVYEERLRLLDIALQDYQSGLLFFYFSSIDQVSHVFFRSLDPEAADADRAYAAVIPELYAKVDRAIGEILARVGPEATVIVMSDHGFTHYRRKVHLNTWLAERGYLATAAEDQRRAGTLGHLDWSKTRAYALGLNQLFVNASGREAFGVVPPEAREALLDELSEALLAWRDPANGKVVVSHVSRPSGADFAGQSPDLIVGYADGYRSSDQSALGGVGAVTIEVNRDKWSGDHCMDPAVVPGVLLTSTALANREHPPGLIDLAPTILGFFDIAVPAAMQGDNLLPP